jgi:penicillin-binding protein 1A
MTPEDSFQDAPVTVEGWSPRNYGSKYVGAVSLKEALARSINTVAVRVSERDLADYLPEGVITPSLSDLEVV